MASEGLGVSKIDETSYEIEGVVKFDRGFEASFETYGHQRAGSSAEILLREIVIGTGRESRVVDPFDSGIVAKEFGDLSAVLDVAVKP